MPNDRGHYACWAADVADMPLPALPPAGHGSFGCQDCIPDTVNSTKFVRDLYELADPTGGWTSPGRPA